MNTNDEVELLEVPGRQYLMIDGSGDPNTSQAYADAVEALFATAYALKFACKRSGVEFAVGPGGLLAAPTGCARPPRRGQGQGPVGDHTGGTASLHAEPGATGARPGRLRAREGGRLLEAMERDPLRSQVPCKARGAGPSADQSPSSGLTANSTPDRLQANFSA